MRCEPWPGSPTANWLANTYTTPWLSVRTVHPERPKPCWGLKGVLEALVTCFVFQVSPPSVDVATMSGCGAAYPLETLRNEAMQTYTLPKYGLLAALSAQTCSLSLKVVEDCGDTITGGIQAFIWLLAAAATSSVRETATASNPLNVSLGEASPSF